MLPRKGIPRYDPPITPAATVHPGLGPGNWPGHNRAFPMMPGLAEERTHDRVRYGTTSLFAAIDTSDCTVTFSLLADRTAPSTSANS